MLDGVASQIISYSWSKLEKNVDYR